jgi:hypothetical protein
MQKLIGRKFKYHSYFGDILTFEIVEIVNINGKLKVINENLVAFGLDEIELI